MTTDLLKNEMLYSNLVHLGNYYSLAGLIDVHTFEDEIEEFSNDWHQYNPTKPHIGREGLSLTSRDGKMTGEELTSIREYNVKHNTSLTELSFTQPTAALHKLTCLHEGLGPFIPYLGRTHLIRFKEGGYFPPHRDSQGYGTDSFRLVSLLQKCDPEMFHFIYNGQKIHLSPFRIYFMNTKITHSVMSFIDDAIIFVANVRLNEDSANCVIRQLECN